MSLKAVASTMIPGGQSRSRLTWTAGAILVLWLVYTGMQALYQTGQLHPVLDTLLEYIPGLFGIGLLLAAGRSTDDCFLRLAPLSRPGLAAFFLATPLATPILLSATWSGWHPVNALILNPLGAVSQELFFRCALLPALLFFFPGRPRLAVGLQAALFGLWHTGPLLTGAPVYAIAIVMLVPTLFGVVWGWQTWRDRTVVWAVVYHVILQFINAFYTWGS